MITSERPRIAILSKFPLSYIDSDAQEPSKYHCVWLIVLHKILQLQTQYDIHWVILDKSVRKAYVKRYNGQTFHVYPKARMQIGLWSRYIYDRYQIHKALKEIQPSIIHAWGTEDCYGLAASRYNCRKILSIQGLLVACGQRAAIAKFEQLQGNFYEATTIRRFANVTVESEWGAERVKELNAQTNVQCWEYAIADYFYKVERKIDNAPCCLIAGNNTPVKNVKCAIEAFRKPELRHVKLYMAGVQPGAYDDLPDNIIPLGFVPHSDMTDLIASCWALIHPSLADTCPNIVKEARVMGLPAIVTRDCGAKQYIVHGKSGFIIDSNDSDALAAFTSILTESKEKNIEMGQYDRERCRNEISQQTMFNRLMDIYKSVLND